MKGKKTGQDGTDHNNNPGIVYDPLEHSKEKRAFRASIRHMRQESW